MSLGCCSSQLIDSVSDVTPPDQSRGLPPRGRYINENRRDTITTSSEHEHLVRIAIYFPVDTSYDDLC